MSVGTITELDPIDALGWIDLDDGTRVRFGGTAISGLKPTPQVGTRVRVLGTTTGYKGVLKATRVALVEPEPAPPSPPQAALPESIAWSALLAEYPRWSDVEDMCVKPTLEVPPLELPAHPLFAPWQFELARGPVVVPLLIPASAAPRPVEAAADISFALGDVAFLDQPTWPTCGRCADPLEMCIQLAPAAMQPFGGEGRGFVALFCFACGVRHTQDPAVGHVGWTGGAHRVTRPAGAPTKSSRPASSAQAVTMCPPSRQTPWTLWFVLRSERKSDSAAAVLLGRRAKMIEGPFPGELEDWLEEEELEPPMHPEDVEGAFEEWLAAWPRRGSLGVVRASDHACLGGAPNWDQADRTPECSEHGPMRQLLEHEGGQFLDGSLHAFVCGRAGCVTTRFVAEF